MTGWELGYGAALLAGAISFLSPCVLPLVPGYLAFIAGQATAGPADATVAATRSGELSGTGLLATYAAGLATPFLVAAAFTEHFSRVLSRLRRWRRWLHPVSGGILILVGLAMMTSQLTAFAYWLLEAFPILGGLG